MDAELRDFFMNKAQEALEQVQDLIKMKEILEPYADKMQDPKMKGIVDAAIDALTGLRMLYGNIVGSGADQDDKIARLDLGFMVALADELDQAGLLEEAEQIDDMLKSAVDVGKFDPNIAPTQERLGLPEHEATDGQDDLDSHLNAVFEEYSENPTPESFANLEEAMRSVLEKSQAQDKQLTPEETVEQVKQQDEQVGVPEDGWPENPEYKITKEIFNNLVKIADTLDENGAKEAANKLDAFLQKHAEDFLDYKGEDENSEQAKRYDSKHHHALQVREPKKEQERVDFEGRAEHHVSTQKETKAHSLNTRHCPEHIGVSLGRVGENVYQCPLDGQVYNWETGWTDYDGNKHPGSSVAAQTPDSAGYNMPHRMFDTRENIMNGK